MLYSKSKNYNWVKVTALWRVWPDDRAELKQLWYAGTERESFGDNVHHVVRFREADRAKYVELYQVKVLLDDAEIKQAKIDLLYEKLADVHQQAIDLECEIASLEMS